MTRIQTVLSETAEKIADSAYDVKAAYQRTTLSREGAKVAFSRAARKIADGTRTVAGVYKTGFSKEGAKIAFNGAVKNITNRRRLISNGLFSAAYVGTYAAVGLTLGTATGGGILFVAGVYVGARLACDSATGSYKALKEEQKKQEILAKHAPPAPWKTETTKTRRPGLGKLLRHGNP